MAKQIRGTHYSKELNPEALGRDTRPLTKKFIDWLQSPTNRCFFMLMLVGVSWSFYGAADMIFLFVLLFFFTGMRKKEFAPLKIPKQEGILDPNDLNPGSGKPQKSDGIFFFGNEQNTGKEVWITNSDCRQHFLVLGTTGAGKSLSNNSNVHTPGGFVNITKIKIGDLVTLRNGKNAVVKGVFPQGELQMFRIYFEDGRFVDACENHQWEVMKYEKKEWFSKTINTDSIKKELHQGKQIFIPLPEPVEKNENPEIINAFEEGKNLYEFQNSNYYTSQVDRYENSSLAQRFDFMKGVLSGNCILTEDFIAIKLLSQNFAKDVQKIIWSLGGICHLKYEFGFYVLEILHETPSKLLSGKYPKYFLGDRKLGLKLSKVVVAKKEEATCISVDSTEPLFITDNYIVTHNTEALLSFSSNAMTWGSGFLFCDGKGDVSLFAKVFALARRFGREDDLLVLNFMIDDKQEGVKSNTMNPYASGAADNLVQMTVSLMDDTGGDGAMWKGRATAMLTGVLRALAFLRDDGVLDLNVGVIRDYMQLRMIIDLADEQKTPQLPNKIRKTLRSYLSSLPGYQEDKGYKQSQTTLDQHGYLEMQFTKILGSLADVYGHVFDTPYAEIDMYDVVINRRILVIMLPALQKSGDEIANLGKIVASTLKNMMGRTLGSNIEGSFVNVVENRPTTSPSPFLCILDEVGYYTVDGMALMAAQARSLGFSMIYASQDIPAMKRLNEKEAASIIANTNIKIFMRTEEADATGKLAVEAGGKAMVAKLDSYEVDEDIGGYKGGKQAKIEERDRINFLDIKNQSEGEMTLIQKDTVVRLKSFYAAPFETLDPHKLKLRANHFIEVRKPPRSELLSLKKTPELLSKLTSPDFKKIMQTECQKMIDEIPEGVDNKDEVSMLADWIIKMKNLGSPEKNIERLCGIVQTVMDEIHGAVEGFETEVKDTRYSSVFDNDDDEEDDDDEDIETRIRRMRRDERMNREREMENRHRERGMRSVRHDVEMHDRRIPMDAVGDNDSILKAVAEMYFDPEDETTSRDSVSSSIDNAINSNSERMRLSKNEIRDNVDEIHTKTSIIGEDDEDEDESGGNDNSDKNQEQILNFLEQILSEQEDDES